MSQRSVILNFPKSLIDRPIISELIKRNGIEINILQAYITPEEDGRMFVIFKGKQESIDKALAYIEQIGLTAILPAQNLYWHEDLCVHCGACVGQCPSHAFTLHEESAKIEFHAPQCIACELCIPACGYGALESVREHLKKTGVL